MPINRCAWLTQRTFFINITNKTFQGYYVLLCVFYHPDGKIQLQLDMKIQFFDIVLLLFPKHYFF
jgi:hypothetical protein